jgi:hypothetical protein
MNNVWTAEETAILRKMMKDCHSFRVIAKKLGRTLKSIEEKWYRLNMSEDVRERRRERARRRRQADNEKRSIRSHSVLIISTRPTSDLLAERDAKSAIPPRDLTAAFCGDPKPGFSALERRT